MLKIIKQWIKHIITNKRLENSGNTNIAINDNKCYSLNEKRIINTGGANMRTVFDVAKYILEKQGPMSTMKLQKLCYYSQAWSLAWDGTPLFDDDFEAWANGPVCPRLFSIHRGQFRIDSNNIQNAIIQGFTPDEIETIDTVLKYYGDKSPQWLSDLTHKERPWREARIGIPPGEQCNNVISKDSMLDYYGGL